MNDATPPEDDSDLETLDLLHGAEEIAAFLYGDRRYARRVRNHAENQNLPIFPVGKVLHAAKRDLIDDIRDKKNRNKNKHKHKK
ncbi:hypothetical protein ACFFJ7_18900 [Pseudochelatococcus lubricantis]|uniref:hypothetical protein n=1 Tax=Pseudochelatococcus lubricantis TaxID=1538102 RepID=UPI0035ED4A96